MLSRTVVLSRSLLLRHGRSITSLPKEEPRLLEMVKEYYDRAGNFLDIDEGELELIKGCDAVLRVTFPFKRRDGRYVMHLNNGLKY